MLDVEYDTPISPTKLDILKEKELEESKESIDNRFSMVTACLSGSFKHTSMESIDNFHGVCRDLNQELYEKLKRGNTYPTIKAIIEHKDEFLR